MSDGKVAAALDEAKRIADGLNFACRNPDWAPDFTGCGGPAAEAYWNYFTPARVTSLVAALGEALAWPKRWRDEAQSLRDTAGEVAMDYPDAPGIALKHARASGLDDAAKALEHYISRALPGEDGSNGGS